MQSFVAEQVEMPDDETTRRAAIPIQTGIECSRIYCSTPILFFQAETKPGAARHSAGHVNGCKDAATRSSVRAATVLVNHTVFLPARNASS